MAGARQESIVEKVEFAPRELNSNEVFDNAFFHIINQIKLSSLLNNNDEEEDGFVTLSKLQPPKIEVTALEPTNDSLIYGAKIKWNNKTIVLLSPASDSAEINDEMENFGTTSLLQVSEKIRLLQKEEKEEKEDSRTTYVFPLAECQRTRLFIKRSHWTLLMVEGNNCYFYDAKSNLSSLLYSLSAIETILAKNNFVLKNINYCGWQMDHVSCGYYAGYFAAIAVDNEKQLLSQPRIEDLIDEFNLCQQQYHANLSDEYACIFQSNSIRSARGLGYAEIVTRNELLKIFEKKSLDSYHIWFKGIIGTKFFERGEGGVKQFKADFLQRKFLCNGNKLDCAPDANEGQIVDHLAKMFKKNDIAVRKILAALSQGPASFLPYVLGLRKFPFEKIVIAQPDKDEHVINLVIEEDNVRFVCQYTQIPVVSLESAKIIGYLQGPIVVSHQLLEQNQTFGFELRYVRTRNDLILDILRGKLFSEEGIIQHIEGNETFSLVSKKDTAAASGAGASESAPTSAVTPRGF